MKTFLKIGFLTLAIIFSGKVAARENMQENSSLQHYYDSELFHWNYDMFGGLMLNYQNQSSGMFYGIKESMKDAFIQYGDTNRQYRSYRNKTIAGNILLWSGLAAVFGGAFVPALADRKNIDTNMRIGLGIMAGGLVSELIGSFIFTSGQENIFNAVNLYNRHKISEYK